MTDFDHTIFQLRNAMKNAEPGPYELYTSNSFRRVGLANKYKEIVYAHVSIDGFADIAGEVHLHAMVMAFNAVPALLEEIERLQQELRAARLEIVDTAREGLRLAAAMREGSTVRVPVVGEL